MERRFQVRLAELRKDAEVPARLVPGVLPRLEAFLEPFVAALDTAEQRINARQYVSGLLSDLDSKDAESIAYLHGRDRQGMQKFIGQSPWEHQPLLTELARQVGEELGAGDGVLVFDPSAFPKQGTESVGVQRQWCGRLGKIENCQVGVYLGYVSRQGQALVDVRLYLPREWAKSKRRRRKAGVPEDIRFRTRHELALEMLDAHGPGLPHAWIAGDDELGRSSWFRRELRARQECYLLAVPANTLVRDLTAPDPPYRGRGPRPKVPFVRVDRWRAEVAEKAWQTIDVRDGDKGPLVMQVVRCLVQARTEGQPSEDAELLVVVRQRQEDGSWKYDYLLAVAPLDTPREQFAWVFNAEHRIEEALKQAKGEAGLADYQVRTWEGWHHHQTMSLLATWFLTQETRRGKNLHPRPDGPTSASPDRWCAKPPPRPPWSGTHSPYHGPSVAAQRRSQAVSLETPQPLTASPL